MILYPYSKIKTNTLFPLLLAARIAGALGYITLAFAAISALFSFGGLFVDSNIEMVREGSGFWSLTPNMPGALAFAMLLTFWALLLMLISGFAAAVVSWEAKRDQQSN